MGRNCASQERTGLGRRLAVVSSAWDCRMVVRAACKAWLCCNARRMASSMGMRAEGGCIVAARGGGVEGFCCAAAEAGMASRARAHVNPFLKWILLTSPGKKGQPATKTGTDQGKDGWLKGGRRARRGGARNGGG